MVIITTLFQRSPMLCNSTLKRTMLFRGCLTLLDVVNSKIVSTLIWYCPTSRRHIKQKTTLKQRIRKIWHPMRNFLLMIHYYFQFLTMHSLHKSKMSGLSNGKWVSLLIPEDKRRKLFSVINQRNRSTHLYFLTIIIISLKRFLKNTWVSF